MSTKKILIVDDEPDMAEFIADVVEGEGLEPIIATSAKEALKHLNEQEVCGIFTDIVMPDMDGIELIQAIAKTGKYIPTVLISGYNPGYMTITQEIGKARGIPIIGYITKPFKADQVIKFMSKMIDISF